MVRFLYRNFNKIQRAKLDILYKIIREIHLNVDKIIFKM